MEYGRYGRMVYDTLVYERNEALIFGIGNVKDGSKLNKS